MSRIACGERSRWLLKFCDALFGRDETDPGPGIRRLAGYLGVALLLAVIIAARRPDAVTTPQFWAEDSTIYFWQQLTRGFWGALGTFYNDYPMLAQRLIAGLGAWVPLADAPRVYTTAAIALTALALATFALPAFRHFVRSDALRVLWCIAVVCLPVDQEMLSNPTNLGWYLAIWFALLSVMRAPRTWWRVAGLVLCGTVVVFTTPLVFITAPVWMLRTWHAIMRRSWRALWLSLALAGALVAVVPVSHDLGVHSPTIDVGGEAMRPASGSLGGLDRPVQIGTDPRWYRLVADRIAALGVLQEALPVLRAAPASVSVTLASLAVAAVVCVCAAGAFRTLPGVLLASYFALGGLLLTVCGRPQLLILGLGAVPVRYTVFPAAMFVLTLISAMDGIPSARGRAITTALLAMLFVWAWGLSFTVQPFRAQRWPLWSARLEHKLAFRTPEPLLIPMNPTYNPLKIDARTMSTEIDVPHREIVGSLGFAGSFRQSFVSRCDGLSEVDLYLGTTALTAQGTLTVTVFVGMPLRQVASVTLPRAEIVGPDWYPFYFPPVTGSVGQVFTVGLRANNNQPETSILVIGSHGNPYPAGNAVFTQHYIDADASIRYGCTITQTMLPREPGGPVEAAISRIRGAPTTTTLRTTTTLPTGRP